MLLFCLWVLGVGFMGNLEISDKSEEILGNLVKRKELLYHMGGGYASGRCYFSYWLDYFILLRKLFR
jgi:hypothetical protein